MLHVFLSFVIDVAISYIVSFIDQASDALQVVCFLDITVIYSVFNDTLLIFSGGAARGLQV